MDETIQKIYKCVESLWQKEFNPEGTEAPNVVTQSNEEWAQHFCQRLNFCDKYKPKLKTNYTESEISLFLYYYLGLFGQCLEIFLT